MLKSRRVTLVLGTQFGDEGKGKIVDFLSAEANLVCRVQGGNNAGHTIHKGDQKFVTHLLPSAILHHKPTIALAAGMVIDPFVLWEEMEILRESGVAIPLERIHIDGRAHLILPCHKLEDAAREGALHSKGAAIGTTGRGIGPAYAARAYRTGPRLVDLLTPGLLEKKLKSNPALQEGLDSQKMSALLKIGKELSPCLADVSLLTYNTLDAGGKVLFEGAQGSMLDISFGSYPYVTSTSLLSAACLGAVGVAPQLMGDVFGICKAYATRVGNGPFVGEISDTHAIAIREKGSEFGATTGRPRRIGWLDLAALRYYARLNGLTGLFLTKADVLDGLPQVGLITKWKNVPPNLTIPFANWDQVEPEISYVEGWEQAVDGHAEGSPQLSPALVRFVERVEEFVGVPVIYVSYGPGRDQGLWRKVP